MSTHHISARILLLLLFCRPLSAQDLHWVSSWACAPQLTERQNLPPAPLAQSTLRQFVRLSLGGPRWRVRFSNAYGTRPVFIEAAHVALAAGTGSAGQGQIDPATDKPIAFNGASSTSIPPGQTILSDPVDCLLPAPTNLAVSIYFGTISSSNLTGHPGSRTTSFILPGSAVSAPNLKDARTTAHWYMLAGIDVAADANARAVVTLGDSLTDGRGSTTDANNRWPDNLARRLAANPPTANVAVANMGIGGNGIFGGLGPSAISRFGRDVLDLSGARWVVVFEGINDIGGDRSGTTALASRLIAAYTRFATDAHARSLRAYGATLLPFGRNSYFTPAHEAVRQAVNAWWRTNTTYDAVIDFDAVVRDPLTLTNLAVPYDSGDHLHLNPAGYQALANAIDLSLFTH